MDHEAGAGDRVGQLKPIIDSFRDWGRDCYCAPGKDNTCGKRFGWQLGDLPFGYVRVQGVSVTNQIGRSETFRFRR